MNLLSKKLMAGRVLNCSPKRVVFDPARAEDISKAVTKNDIRKLIVERAIVKLQKTGISRFRARKIKSQKRKGLQRGQGSRKGKKGARRPRKQNWMTIIRLQRRFLKELKDKDMIENKDFRELYMKCKGGYFRSKRHLKLHINEKNLIKKGKNTVE